MHALRLICSLLLIAEFVMAPINLWTGHTMPNFIKFTGFKPSVARMVFAPVKLLGALLLIVGLFVPKVGAVGAVIIGTVCLVYVARLLSPKRRDAGGSVAFLLGLVCSVVVVLAVRS